MAQPYLTLSRRTVLGGLAVGLAAWPGGGLGQTPGSPDAWRTLTAAPRRIRLRPEPAGETEAWALDGEVPGPVIRVRHGEEVRLRLSNETPRPLSLHWHGVRGPSAMDGVGGFSQEPVLPGRSFDYRFTPPDAGTYLVRPLVVGGSGEPAGRGVSALLVVEEREPARVDQEIALVVSDWRLEDDGSLSPFGRPIEAATGGRLGNVVTVNGRPDAEPIAVQPGSRIRLRLANAANARAMRIRFEDLKTYVIAVDGQPTDSFEPLRSALPFSPGSRYDLLVDLPAETGSTGRIVAMLGQGLPLVRLTTAGQAPDRPPLPPIGPLPANRLLPPAIRLQDAVRRDVEIAGGARRGPDGQPLVEGDPARIWTVNGRPGASGGAPLVSVKRGSPVVLTIANRTPMIQPLHLHGHAFRLLHPFDDGWEPYWLDTLQVPENRTVRIAFEADNPGRWVFGSAVLERFDTGLWTWFEVT